MSLRQAPHQLRGTGLACTVAILALLCLAATGRKTAATPSLVTLRDEEDFAAFYGDAELGLVVYTSTNCNTCAHVITTVRNMVKRIKVDTPTTAAIPVARIVHDVTMPEEDALFSRPPHNAPETPSIGVVRGGRLVPRRWTAGVDDATKMETLLRDLLIPDVVPLTTVADAKRLLPTPQGWAGGSYRYVPGQRERIVLLGLFPVPSPLEAELREVADYLRTVTNITVAVSHDAAVARYFGQLDIEASIGAFHEMRAGAAPHWHRDSQRRARLECEGSDDPSSALSDQCTDDGRALDVSVRDFVGWHARPWVSDSVDGSKQSFVPGRGGDMQVSLVTSSANVTEAILGIAREARERVGERVIVAVGWPPTESHESSMLPWGVTIGTLRAAARDHGVVLGGVTAVNDRQYSKRSWLLSRATTDAVVAVVDDVRKQRIKPYVRSEPLPAIAPKKTSSSPLAGSATSPNLATIVGESFEELVVDSGKHTLLLITSSTCDESSECLMLYTIFNDLADVFRNDDTLTVAVINGDENDMPRAFTARNSFPEIAFVNHYVGALPEWYALELVFEDLWRFTAQRLLSWEGSGTPVPKPKRSASYSEAAKKKSGGRRRGHRGIDPRAIGRRPM